LQKWLPRKMSRLTMQMLTMVTKTMSRIYTSNCLGVTRDSGIRCIYEVP
jgi:hypothetical protein